MEMQLPTTPSTQGSFACEECSESFSNKGYLTIHRRTHTPAVTTCPLCTKTFSRKAHLPAHIRSHLKEKSFQCPKCTFSTVTKGALSRHYKETHLKEKPYECKECSKSFSRKENFHSHNLRVHNGGKIKNDLASLESDVK